MSTLRLLAPFSRRRTSVASVVALSLLFPLIGTSPASAADPGLPKDVAAVRIGLIKLGSALADAAEQPALSEDLPLTDTSVRDILSLDTAIGTKVERALSTKTDTTLDTLDDAFTDGQLTVKEAVRSPKAPVNSREWTLTVALAADRRVALAYVDPKKRLELGAAALDGDVAATLDATIRFRYDPDAIAMRQFSVVGSTELTTHVWTSDDGVQGDVDEVDIPDFKVVDGFVELDASGRATVDSTTVLTLRDPNGRGQITTEDLEFSSATDLFVTTTKPAADDVAMDIDLSTPMDGTATGAITVGERAADATTTYAAPKVTRSGSLDGLSSLTRLQAITGFTQYTSALQSVEATVDQQFPLLDLSLSDIYSPAQQLLSLLTEQATAAVQCGAANTSPPSGAPRPGEARYCQAVTGSFEAKAGETIDWESPDADVSISGSTAGTVGRTPTHNVKVTGGDGFPTLRVTFTADDGTVRHARSAVSSIQDLGQAIDKLGLDGEVGYDPDRQSLQIKVRNEDSGSKELTRPTGGNGNLAPLTGLAGLCQAAKGITPRECRPTGDTPTGGVTKAEEGSAKVTVDGRTFDADFGIGLAEPAEVVEGQPLPAGPTFYLVPGDDGLVYQVDNASASLAADAQMVARIGFLQVDVDVTGYSVSQSGKAASVSVPTGTVTLPSTESVDDAVDIADLLAPTAADAPTVQRGLTAKATLAVKDSAVSSGSAGPIGADGTVKASWSNLLPGSLPTVTTEGDYDKLRLLDIVPAKQGTMGAGTGNGVIKDPKADFLKQFGIAANQSADDSTVTRPLYDLGVPGSSSTICSRFVVNSATQLTCTEGPLKEDGVVAEGHSYIIDGDQDALRDVVIEDVAGVVKSFATPQPELGADRTFPLVDVLPTEISIARDGLGTTIDGIQDLVDKPDPLKSVSSMQDFTKNFRTLLNSAVTGLDSKTAGGLDFSLSTSGPTRLILESSLATKGTRDAPLRVAAQQSELKVLDAAGNGATLPVDVTSNAKLVIGINLADASSQVRADTGVSEQITKVSGDATRLAAVKATLAAKDADYGSARVTTGAVADIDLGIGVKATTSPTGADDAWIDIAELPQKMEQVRAVAGAAQTCGGAATSKTAACIEIPTSASTDKVTVSLEADQSSGGTGGSMKTQPIAYRFLAEALGGLNLTLADALDGDQTLDPDTGAPLSLPLVGTNLDAGADVVADVNRYVGAARTALKSVETTVGKDDGVAKLDTELTTALGKVTTALASKNITASAGAIALDCAGICKDTDADGKQTDKTVDSVQKISVPIVISGQLPAPQMVPFQAGPAGSTIVSDLKVPVTTTWTLKVTVGIARGTGPFVRLGEATPTSPLLSVSVSAELPKNSAQACHSWARHTAWLVGLPGTVTNKAVAADGSGDAQCIDAFVGKFPSAMVDRKDNGKAGTFLTATVVVDVQKPAGTDADGQVYLPTLYDRKADFSTTVTGDGALSVYFESFAGQAGFFDVVGLIDLGWKDGEYADTGLQYGQLKIDVGTLNEAVFPGFKKALAWTAPLNPVVEQLAKPIPVVTNLSELVGQGPVTMLSLLQKKNTPINLIVNLLQMQNIVANKPASEVDLRPIGAGDINGFKVSPNKVGVGGKCTETGTANGKPFERKNDGKGASGRCKLGNLTKMKQYVKGEKPEKDPKGLKIDKTVTKSPYLSLPSVSVPVLQDTAQIFNLLQDTGDATMLYVDLGHAGISGQIVRSFGPFAVGPIPVTATMGGTVGLDGRFAFGFDTRGLSKRIESLDTGHIAGFDDIIAEKPSLFSDGFYIDDLEKGVDVPEIQLTFTVQAGAAISIGIVEAGISGGATLDLSLDAFDPNGDGKIYTDEFAGTATGPACAFNVSSGISFFLQFYFSIEFIFYTFHKSFDIARSPRLKLFEFNCEVPTPVLALDRVVDGKPALVLTMGTEYLERKGFQSEKAEKYTVRQVGGADPDGKILLQVSAFGITENHLVAADTVVRANGADGSDTVRLYPIPAVTKNAQGQAEMAGPGDAGYVPPRFTARAVLQGGSGSDTIETGDGNDVVDGDAGNGSGGADGNDVIRTGAGDDIIRGGAGLDQLDGGQGSDQLLGGGDDDRLNGGPGADDLRGGDGDDTLDGGIGAAPDSLFPVATAAAIRPLLDSGDLVVGGNGADTVDGGDGSDIVVGGDYDGTPAVFTDKVSVTVDAMDEDRKILRVPVTDIPTVKTPTDAAVQTQCASSGATGETGPDVVTGGPDQDVVIGGAGSDSLSGGGGKDVVCGRGGDDLLDGDGTEVDVDLQGDDTVRGGPGRDRIYGSGGKDVLYGDPGDDLIRGGNGADTIAGGAGSDLLLGEAGLDTVAGDNPDGAAEVAADPADAGANGRTIVCGTSTSVVGGRIDLDGDLAGNDDGQLEGLSVLQGVVQDAATGGTFTGVLNGNVFSGGLVDLDGNGTIEPRTATALGDTGSIPLAGITGAAGNGDCVLGGDEVDTSLLGGAGADYIDAGAGDDQVVRGGSGDDLVRGGDGNDKILGDSGNDLVAGDAGDDILFGNAGDDVLRGGADRDLLAGGSGTSGAVDGADEVLGDGGDDVVLGGNASLSTVPIVDSAFADAGVTLLETPVTSGAPDDQVFGGVGDDWVFAQEGDDRANGGPGDDIVEGGPGADRVQGDDDADLLIGGSSTTGAVTTVRSAQGAPDGDDTVVGDEGVDGRDGSDVMAGDNASLQVDTTAVRASWQRIRRDVAITLFDVPSAGSPMAMAPSAHASGNDTMNGGGSDDLIVGQSGSDLIDAGDGADAVEGGAGQDAVRGGAGDDEILGGSWNAATSDDSDDLSGDAGDDVVLGDNGRPANGFSPYVALLDVPAAGAHASAGVSGDDTIAGGDGDDRLFGQGGGDVITGDTGADVLEGDAGGDTMSGGADDDVLTGGSSSGDGVISPDRSGAGQLDGADVLSGGGGNDVLAGDNARLDRTGRLRTDGTSLRSIRLFDVATAADAAPGGTAGADRLEGDAGRDLAFGQAGDDAVFGGTGDDYLEGNDGADTLTGGDGEDDVVGGGSSRTGAIITVSGADVSDRLLTAPAKATDISAASMVDGNDVLDGGDSRDVLLGDNGRITRDGPGTILTGGASGPHVVRQVAMADKLPGVWAGSDVLTGGAGDDDLYGQFDNTRTRRPQTAYRGVPVAGDVLQGGTGDDAIVGDQGTDVPTPAKALGAVDRTIKDKESFLREVVRPHGSLVRVVTLTHATEGGDDLVMGDEGADSIHAGAGKDVINAGAGNDVVFAGDDADALWGGSGHDRLFGGAGNDLLDVKRRADDSMLSQVAAPVEDTDRVQRTINGRDVLYGGSGADALQADQGDLNSSRRVQGDRLIDWRASVNAFQTCRSVFGPGKILDEANASMTKTLRELAKASGAVGSTELAIPTNERATKYPGRSQMVCETR